MTLLTLIPGVRTEAGLQQWAPTQSQLTSDVEHCLEPRRTLSVDRAQRHRLWDVTETEGETTVSRSALPGSQRKRACALGQHDFPTSGCKAQGNTPSSPFPTLGRIHSGQTYGHLLPGAPRAHALPSCDSLQPRPNAAKGKGRLVRPQGSFFLSLRRFKNENYTG